MDENQSPVIDNAQSETPESDPILDTLTSDEDASAEAPETVEEQEVEEETEAEAEAEQPIDEEESQPELDPKEEARRGYLERQREREARRLELNVFAKQKSDEIRQGAEDEYDQRLKDMEARDFEREVERYVERVENNESTLTNEYERVKANPDLQIFNRESPEFNEKAYIKALKDFNAGYVKYDELGNIAEVKESLYKHFEETADLLRGAIKTGQVQQVRAAQELKQKADIKPAATPKEPQKDVILEILKSD